MTIRKEEAFVEGLVTNAPGTIMGEIADAARRSYCSVYSNNPAWAFAKRTFVLPIVKRTLDRYCADFPPAADPPDPPDFTGGQCVLAPYRVEVEYNLGTNQPTRTRTADVFGAVVGASAIIGTEIERNEIIVVASNADGSNPNFQYVIDASSLTLGSPDFVNIINITRLDGLPDDCGDPPAPPYDEIPDPEDEDRIFDVDITNSDGDTNTYQTEITQSADNYLNYPPIIIVNDVEVGFDIGGVTFNNVTNRRSGGGGGTGEDKVLEDDPNEEDETEEEEKPETGVPEVVEAENLVAIEITAVGDDTVYDSTAGRGAPDVFRIGWVEFKKGQFFFSRQFINFEKSRFDAPDDADGYAITLVPGWLITVKEIRKKTEVQS